MRRIRETSIKAYIRILESGQLTEARAKVLRHFINVHPETLTERELDHQMDDVNAHKRVSELHDQGLLEEVGERACKVSQNPSSIEWGLRDNPILRPLERRPCKKRIRKEEVFMDRCGSCLFRDTDASCMAAPEGVQITTLVGERPDNCPLDSYYYVIRGAPR